MKKYFKTFLALIMVFALTGCVKYNMNMEVNANKEVKLELIYAIDTSYMEQFNTNEENQDDTTTEAEDDDTNNGVKAEDYNFLKEKGYTVEEFKEEKDGKKYNGVKISKTFKSIDDITKEEEKSIDINKLLGDKDTFDDSQFFSKKGNTYKADLVFNFKENGDDSMGSLGNNFDLKYSIKLPVKAKEDNATEKSADGKTLTWNLKYGEENKINYSFELNKNNTIIYIGIGVSILVVAGIATVILKKKKN